MPYSLRIRTLPVFSPSDPAQWIIGTCGTFLAASGDGWSKLGADPTEIIGRSLWEWAGERDDVRRLVARVLAGALYDGTIEFGGIVWYISCVPLCHPQRGVIGCACTAYPLQPGGELPAPPEPETEPEPTVEVWEAAGDNVRAHVWSGDRFIVKPDGPVQLVRQIPRAEFDGLRAADPTRLHRLYASGRPRLRLL
jgi:hypothetical protein